MGKIKGKKVLCVISGGSQGIGQSIAVEISKVLGPGSKIVLIARSADGLEKTRQLVLSASHDVQVKNYTFDLSLNEYAKYVTMFEENKGSYDVALVVHNAGSEGNGNLTKEMNDAGIWEKEMSLNVYSVTTLTSAFLKAFEDVKLQKTLVNITSLAGIQPMKSMGYYCITRAAREMYFRTLAEENEDLDVLSYSPGPVETDMITRLIGKVADNQVKDMFKTMKDDNKLIKPADTIKKLIDSLDTSNYKSGGRLDYFDL